MLQPLKAWPGLGLQNWRDGTHFSPCWPASFNQHSIKHFTWYSNDKKMPSGYRGPHQFTVKNKIPVLWPVTRADQTVLWCLLSVVLAWQEHQFGSTSIRWRIGLHVMWLTQAWNEMSLTERETHFEVLQLHCFPAVVKTAYRYRIWSLQYNSKSAG